MKTAQDHTRQDESPDLARRRQHPNPIPVSKWQCVGNVWPTANGWYNMLRPENQRNELVEADVASFVNE